MASLIEREFDSQIKLLNKFSCDPMLIKQEPMFFNASYDFAFKYGGEITKSFLSHLPGDWKKDVVFDSRSHMLMPGWYPAIPGFHHDDVPRPKIPTGQHFITAGQPDYDNMLYKAEHIMGLVNAEISPTLFALGKIKVPAVPEGELIYRKWDSAIKQIIEKGGCETFEAPDRQLIYFDWQCFHTGQKSVSNGWRWFGRVSRNTERVNKLTNEIRNQSQVYLEFPMEGW